MLEKVWATSEGVSRCHMLDVVLCCCLEAGAAIGRGYQALNRDIMEDKFLPGAIPEECELLRVCFERDLVPDVHLRQDVIRGAAERCSDRQVAIAGPSHALNAVGGVNEIEHVSAEI
jgi:hypothetical protein